VSTDTRTFPTTDVISATTGILVGTVDGVYEVLSHAVGDTLFTHQLPNASRVAEDHLYTLIPWARKIPHPDNAPNEDREDYLARLLVWVEAMVQAHGETVAVPAMSDPDWVRDNALSDLQDLMGDRAKVIAVVAEEDQR